MNVLVLGGNGFIGSHLVDQLITLGHKVRVFDRGPEQFRKPLIGVDYRYGDFNEKFLVSDALQGIEVVFHLICTSVPSTSNLSPADDVSNNLVDTINLLENMKNTGVRKIVYMSSGGTIYGNSRQLKITEDHPLNPICSYGIVKLAVEKYLLMYQKLYKFEPIILRASNPYGPRQSKIGLQGLISTILNKAIDNETVEVWGDGEAVRDYLYISDLVRACTLAIDKNICGVFNIGSGIGYSINQVIDLIEEVCLYKIKVTRTKTRKLDVSRSVLDIQKAKNIIGWSPKISIQKGILLHKEWLNSL